MIENKICYSQNVFPADGKVVERTARIAENFNRIKNTLKISKSTPFPLGLWLDAKSAAELADPTTLDNLKTVLATNNNSVFTINAFPYGRFHATEVKENVYQPDWTTQERVDFTLRVADVLAELLPPGMVGSISTLPGGYGEDTEMRSNGDAETGRDGETGMRRQGEGKKQKSSILNDPSSMFDEGTEMENIQSSMSEKGDRLGIIASNLRRVADHLAAIFAKKGVRIILAVEMEPDCLWESPAEFIAFRNEFLIGHPSEEFIGVCYDTCHQELLGSAPGEGLKLLEDSGVPVPKIQLSAAITREIRGCDELETAFKELARFAEGVYLHQTRLINRGSGGVILKLKDIPSPSIVKDILDDDAFSKLLSSGSEPLRLVSHFHTPIHMNKLSDELTTAKNELNAILRILSERPTNELPHLEIETYTYNVLPGDLREISLHDSMTNEYRWVMEHFEK